MSPVNEVSRNKGKTKLRDAPIPSLSKTNFDQKSIHHIMTHGIGMQQHETPSHSRHLV